MPFIFKKLGIPDAILIKLAEKNNILPYIKL